MVSSLKNSATFYAKKSFSISQNAEPIQKSVDLSRKAPVYAMTDAFLVL